MGQLCPKLPDDCAVMVGFKTLLACITAAPLPPSLCAQLHAYLPRPGPHIHSSGSAWANQQVKVKGGRVGRRWSVPTRLAASHVVLLSGKGGLAAPRYPRLHLLWKAVQKRLQA